MATTWEAVVHGPHKKAIRALVRAYGDDSTAILNALHEMAARVAIAAGTEPEAFAAGMKYHWDNLANAFNEKVESNHVN